MMNTFEFSDNICVSHGRAGCSGSGIQTASLQPAETAETTSKTVPSGPAELPVQGRHPDALAAYDLTCVGKISPLIIFISVIYRPVSATGRPFSRLSEGHTVKQLRPPKQASIL